MGLTNAFNTVAMNTRFVPLILGTVALSAAAQFLLKLGMSSQSVQQTLANGIWTDLIRTVGSNVYVILGLVAYGLSAAAWLLVLARTDLSVAYPFVALGFILTLVFGALYLGEPVGIVRTVGTLLVCAGVYVIAKS